MRPVRQQTAAGRTHDAQRRHYGRQQSKASGDVAGAVRALAQLRPDMQRALGPEHHHTQITRSNLPNLQAKREM